jgi:DNA-binding SARP family transcriptional activator/predicted ATPase
MEFRILGPLEVVRDGRPIRLDRQRLRALLAYLLLHANEAVSADQLIDQIWGPEPPKTASASLQNYISRLRKALGPELLLSRPPGYLLRVDPERFDLTRFERLAAEARGAPPRERSEKLRAALSLWRGRVLEDLAFEAFVQEEARRLEEARLSAFEERIDADLELGESATLVTELEELVEGHPLRERFHGQLMLALYRAGRQADALEAYQRARRVLDEELGLEPSEELRALQQAILQQDASLGARASTEQDRPADRRVVTVLFCDLVGSTDLATRLDPEAYRILMERYFTAVRAPIERHGGTVEKFIGDAVMAAFGVPELHEDDALRAVRAAVDIRTALGELAELAQAEWDVPFAGRIGVNSGQVHVVSRPGEDLHLTGAAVSIASKLEESAPPGEILLGEETLELVRDAVRAEPFEGVIPSWQLEDLIAGAPAYARRLDAPLVGREEDLERLTAAFDNARRERHCSVVTVVGEAGIGKTRLIRELVARVGDEGRVLVGRCVSYGEGATYLPIAEIIRAAVPDASVAGIKTVLAGNDDADQVARRVAELIGIEEGPSAPGEAFWSVRRLVEAVAGSQPTLLVLDDIHWAEPTLLDLVEYLGAWAEAPILIVCAARRELIERRPEWGGPTSTGFIVELAPLPPDDVSSLLVGLAPEPLDPELEERIVQHAGGNPLFAEQLLALAAEAPGVALDDPPPTLEALLASRLDRLDPRELGVLRRAAVVGRRFSREELDDLAPPEGTNNALIDLARRGLVHPAEELYRFHHVLVRDVAYRGIPKAERAELHELAARGLDRRDQSDEVIGYHFEQAYRYVTELVRADERALELAVTGGERLGRAGIRAWKRADAPAAVNLLRRAIDLLPEDVATRRELLCELGLVYRVRGEVEEAKDRLDEAVATSVAQGDRRIELRARIELAGIRLFTDTTGANELLELAGDAIPVFEAFADDRALGRAWLSIGFVRGNFQGNNSALEEAAAKAADHSRRAGWSPSTGVTSLASALYYGPHPVDDAVCRCEELLRDHSGDVASEASILVWLGGLEGMRRRFDEGLALVHRARTTYQELGLALAAGETCGLVEGGIQILAGRLEAAEEALRATCETCIAMNELAQLASRAAELADVLYDAHRYDEAETWLDISRKNSGPEDRDAQSSWRSVAARLAARNGDHKRAEELAQEALEIVEATDAISHQAKVLLGFGEVRRLAAQHEKALELVQRAVDLYLLKGNAAGADHARALLTTTAVAN